MWNTRPRPLKERMDTWYSYTGGAIDRFLVHPDDREEAEKLNFTHNGLPIVVMGG